MSGPVRLNLSKGGLGLSFGVKGARVGVNRKGTYVHGGRYGVYYRKYMAGDEEKRNGKHQTVEFFTDTGMTYKSADFPKKPQLPKIKPPPTPKVKAYVKVGMVLGPVLLLTILLGMIPLFLAGLIVTVLSYTIFFTQKRRIRRVKTHLNRLKARLNQKKPVASLVKGIKAGKLPPKHRQWRDFQFFKAFNQQFYEASDYISPEEFKKVEKLLRIPKRQKRLIKRHIFSRFLNAMLEDHFISREEEKKLLEVAENLNLSLQDIPEEKMLMDVMHDIREQISTPLTPVAPSVNLKQGESCYYITEGRLLKEKYIDRFRKNGIVYKAKGYDVDMAGELYLTDRRLLMVSEGSREYRLNKLLDVTLSLEDNTLKLAIEGRKNPVIVTTPEIEVLAGKLERLLLGEGGE